MGWAKQYCWSESLTFCNKLVCLYIAFQSAYCLRVLDLYIYHKSSTTESLPSQKLEGKSENEEVQKEALWAPVAVWLCNCYPVSVSSTDTDTAPKFWPIAKKSIYFSQLWKWDTKYHIFTHLIVQQKIDNSMHIFCGPRCSLKGYNYWRKKTIEIQNILIQLFPFLNPYISWSQKIQPKLEFLSALRQHLNRNISIVFLRRTKTKPKPGLSELLKTLNWMEPALFKWFETPNFCFIFICWEKIFEIFPF